MVISECKVRSARTGDKTFSFWMTGLVLCRVHRHSLLDGILDMAFRMTMEVGNWFAMGRKGV